MPTPLSNVLGSQRRETYLLTTSNAAFPIPTWAQGGKGIVYVTGCGGGGGGQPTTNAGSSAAVAMRHPLIIPPGATTMGLTVGAAGVVGTAGGHTEIAIGGVNVLQLRGGASGAGGGDIAFWSAADSAWKTQIFLANATYNFNSLQQVGPFTLVRGQVSIASAAAPGPFGASGGTVASVGYGAGGNVNQSGAPGLLILEVVEGL